MASPIQLASAFVYGPYYVVAHWFDKRSGLAYGIVALGSSVGGTAFPIAARYLMPLVG